MGGGAKDFACCGLRYLYIFVPSFIWYQTYTFNFVRAIIIGMRLLQKFIDFFNIVKVNPSVSPLFQKDQKKLGVCVCDSCKRYAKQIRTTPFYPFFRTAQQAVSPRQVPQIPEMRYDTPLAGGYVRGMFFVLFFIKFSDISTPIIESILET